MYYSFFKFFFLNLHWNTLRSKLVLCTLVWKKQSEDIFGVYILNTAEQSRCSLALLVSLHLPVLKCQWSQPASRRPLSASYQRGCIYSILLEPGYTVETCGRPPWSSVHTLALQSTANGGSIYGQLRGPWLPWDKVSAESRISMMRKVLMAEVVGRYLR